jgi:PAS domain S-box-containing protein
MGMEIETDGKGKGNGGWRDPRPEADTALLAGESRYRRLVEANIIGVVIADIHGRIKEANDFFLGLIGYSRGELEAGLLNWNGLTAPGWEPIDRKAIEDLIVTGTTPAFEKEYIHKDGHPVPIRATAAMLEGSSEEAICLVEDLTELRRAEAERRQVCERISDAFVALDAEWRYTFVNAKAGELLERSPESLLGREVWKEFPDASVEPFRKAMERSMREQQPAVLEDFYPPLDKWVEIRAYPSAEGLSVYFYDVTARKRAENRIREQLQELLRWQNVTLDREARIQELKSEVNGLLAELGRPLRYRPLEPL